MALDEAGEHLAPGDEHPDPRPLLTRPAFHPAGLAGGRREHDRAVDELRATRLGPPQYTFSTIALQTVEDIPSPGTPSGSPVGLS